MPTSNLTAEDFADLARFLREAIDADRFPFSPRVKRLKALLAKIDPPPPAPEPFPPPPPKPPGERSTVLGKKRRAVGGKILD